MVAPILINPSHILPLRLLALRLPAMPLIERLVDKSPQVVETAWRQLEGVLEVLINEDEQVRGLFVVDDWMVVQQRIEVSEGHLSHRIVFLSEDSIFLEDLLATRTVFGGRVQENDFYPLGPAQEFPYGLAHQPTASLIDLHRGLLGGEIRIDFAIDDLILKGEQLVL